MYHEAEEIIEALEIWSGKGGNKRLILMPRKKEPI
jgi:hypothetical protein